MSFFFNDTATTENYTLSLHGALPISTKFFIGAAVGAVGGFAVGTFAATPTARSVGQSALGGLDVSRSEEHTSEPQSRQYLVCRLLLEKKYIVTHFMALDSILLFF